MGASYRAPGTAEADESTEQAESDMDVRSGSGQVPAADAAASRLAESGKVRTGSTEKKPLKENLHRKRQRMLKHSRVCRRMTQSLRLRIWIDNLDALNGGKMVQMDCLRKFWKV